MTDGGVTPQTSDWTENLSGRYRTEAWLFATPLFDVYRGTDLSLQREVHLRFLKPRFAATVDASERLFAAASSAAGLSHPNLVAVYDLGSVGGRRCVVTEAPAHRLADQRDALTPEDVSRIEGECRAGLDAAHRHDLMHGAIDDGAIFIAADGTAKVGDVGLFPAASDHSHTLTVEADRRALTSVFDKLRIPRRPPEPTMATATMDVEPTRPRPRREFDLERLRRVARSRVTSLLLVVAAIAAALVFAFNDTNDPPTPGRPSGQNQLPSDLPPEIPR